MELPCQRKSYSVQSGLYSSELALNWSVAHRPQCPNFFWIMSFRLKSKWNQGPKRAFSCSWHLNFEKRDLRKDQNKRQANFEDRCLVDHSRCPRAGWILKVLVFEWIIEHGGLSHTCTQCSRKDGILMSEGMDGLLIVKNRFVGTLTGQVPSFFESSSCTSIVYFHNANLKRNQKQAHVLCLIC